MEEDFFKVGYSTYLKKLPSKKQKWTSRILKKILEHKFIIAIILTIMICLIMNIWLVYRFMNILSTAY